jgi:hypothetical protein
MHMVSFGGCEIGERNIVYNGWVTNHEKTQSKMKDLFW